MYHFFFFFNVSFKEKSLCPPERRLTTDSQRLGGCVQGRNNCRKIERQLLKSHGVLTTGRFDEGGRSSGVPRPWGHSEPFGEQCQPRLAFSRLHQEVDVNDPECHMSSMASWAQWKTLRNASQSCEKDTRTPTRYVAHQRTHVGFRTLQTHHNQRKQDSTQHRFCFIQSHRLNQTLLPRSHPRAEGKGRRGRF